MVMIYSNIDESVVAPYQYQRNHVLQIALYATLWVIETMNMSQHRLVLILAMF